MLFTYAALGWRGSKCFRRKRRKFRAQIPTETRLHMPLAVFWRLNNGPRFLSELRYKKNLQCSAHLPFLLKEVVTMDVSRLVFPNWVPQSPSQWECFRSFSENGEKLVSLLTSFFCSKLVMYVKWYKTWLEGMLEGCLLPAATCFVHLRSARWRKKKVGASFRGENIRRWKV